MTQNFARKVVLTGQLCFVFFTLLQPAVAENWGHWRGVSGNGVSTTAVPPTTWSATKNVAWKVPIPGSGSGSPVIWENRVFVVSAVGLGANKFSFQTFCFQRDNGKLLWNKTAVEAVPHEGTHETNGFASASPCTDGQHVYSHFGSRGLYCYTLDGELVWKRDFGDMTARNNFGEGSSPTLVDDLIIVPWDHEGPSFLFALNKLTGETVWKTSRDEPTCWATPLIVETAPGTKQIVMNGQNFARGYDLKTGKELWRCGGQTERPVASAVTDGNLVFVGSGFRGAYLGAFRTTGTGDIAGSSNVAWSVNRDTPDIATPLLSNSKLYFTKAKTGILTCVDAKTGKPFYSSVRVPGMASLYASPVAAGGYVFLTDRSGTVTVIRDTEKFEVVATNELGEGIDATLAPVDNQLFIRGEKHLFCIAK